MRRAGHVLLGAFVVITVAWTGAAFACTAQPQVYSLQPESATPGSAITVSGESVTGSSPVEIRWNGVGGPLLATATPVQGRFATQVKVPNVSPGIYSVMLVTSDGTARAAFEVVGAAAPAPAPAAPLWANAGAPAVDSHASPGPSSLGVALLAVGLAGLFAGSAVAVVRRRPVTVTARR